MTEEQIKLIHEEIDAALKAIGNKYKFSIDNSHITYDLEGFRLTVRAEQLKADGTRVADLRLNDLIVSSLNVYGANVAKGIGLHFFIDNQEYVIVTYNTRARKYPIEYKRVSDGNQYKATPEFIARYVKKVA